MNPARLPACYQDRHITSTRHRPTYLFARAETNAQALENTSKATLRRFVILVHNPLPPCACQLELHSLDQFKLDLVCRCVGAVSVHQLSTCTTLHDCALLMLKVCTTCRPAFSREREILKTKTDASFEDIPLHVIPAKNKIK